MTEAAPRPVILIVDDDSDDRLMMRDAFAECSHHCRTCFARDGVQLMRILNGELPLSGDPEAACGYPDLILLDLNMPLKDGREALQEIKSDRRLRKIPTVIKTTSDDSDDIGHCYESGANSYIIKPSSYSGLLDVVSSLTHYWTATVRLPTRPERHDQQ
jgi:CheY-like chemotaxis protein